MELREIIGYACLLLAVLIVAGGIWAARYFSHQRVYARRLAQERRARAGDGPRHAGDAEGPAAEGVEPTEPTPSAAEPPLPDDPDWPRAPVASLDRAERIAARQANSVH